MGESLDCSPLHARHYADRGVFAPVRVLENTQTATDTYRMRVDAAAIAERIVPGQFLMVRLAGQSDPLLGRAFAVYDVIRNAAGRAAALDFVYLKKGNLTTPLSACEPGREIEVWGPLGNGFTPRPTSHLIMVAGGIGQTPFLALGKEALGHAAYGSPVREAVVSPRVTLCYGVRSAELLAGKDDFRSAGIDLRIASDDGSVGRHGLVTDLLREVLEESAPVSSAASSPAGTGPRVVCCGPEPMMEAVAGVCREAGVACEVSLETPMACGIGICFSCVAPVRQEGGEWDYKRTCVEGPVFDAEEIVW